MLDFLLDLFVDHGLSKVLDDLDRNLSETLDDLDQDLFQ